MVRSDVTVNFCTVRNKKEPVFSKFGNEHTELRFEGIFSPATGSTEIVKRAIKVVGIT